MRILVIRHGDPDYSIDSLTEKGWREANLLADRLAGLNIRDFYCSPLGRAKDTAKPTLEKLGRQSELNILPWLCEFRGSVISPFEERRRIPWNLMPQYWSRQPDLFDKEMWLQHPLMKSGNVEAIYRETCEGMDALLEKYGYHRDGYILRCEENTDDTIVLFCHFAVGMAIIAHMTGAPLPVLWQSFFLPTSSVTTFVTEERVKGEAFFKCLQMGDTSHLYAAGEPVSSSGLFPEHYSGPEPRGVKPAKQ